MSSGNGLAKPINLDSDNIIPVIDFTNLYAANQIIKASEEFGFFKLINHGIPFEAMLNLEKKSFDFFNLSSEEKEKVDNADPFGYGKKTIGKNNDIGRIEYLLFGVNPVLSHHTSFTLPGDSELFTSCVDDYTSAVKNMACDVLEKIAYGMGIEPKNTLSRYLKHEESDTFFRINHYPPCKGERQAMGGGGDSGGSENVIGFGEHTDPQIISVLRSNNASGLQISLKDGTWVHVAPDPYSMFVIIGDTLQVMTNERLKSVKHRVITEGKESRMSMIYFGAPPLNEMITPLPQLMNEGEESLYKEFTWCEFKKSIFRSKLADNRLKIFEK